MNNNEKNSKKPTIFSVIVFVVFVNKLVKKISHEEPINKKSIFYIASLLIFTLVLINSPAALKLDQPLFEIYFKDLNHK